MSSPWVFLCALFYALSALLQAAEPPKIKRPEVSINLQEKLTPKQLGLINSGFTAFTFLSLPVPGAPAKAEPLAHLGCSVRFDTWEERYSVTVHPQNGAERSFVGPFADFAKACLRLEVGQIPAGMPLSLQAHLRVKQTSPEEMKRIKQWLVRQQSGVMRGLFAHMLGELSMSHDVTIPVRVARNNS